jgi:hypothetical protein
MKLKATVFVSVLIAILTMAMSAFALDPGPDGFYNTGSGVRVKKVAFINFDVYAITHYMKGPLPPKSKRAVIDADVDKKFVWTMKRTVDAEKIQNALKEAYAKNGYTNQANINAILATFPGEIKEGAQVTISYNSDKKETTMSVSSGKTATIPGIDFMKGTWSIWFGNIDQPSLGDALISKL